MAFIHPTAREVHFKIVYAGPSRGGKTTNLLRLHEKLPPERRGRLLSLAGPDERTLFFDFMAMHLGEVGGLNTRFHLYTVPGQPEHRLSRRAILRGADALVFVVDSDRFRLEETVASWRELDEPGFLPNGSQAPPRVVQMNKRDLEGALSVHLLRARLGFPAVPEVQAVALEGRGVQEALRLACRAALARFAPVAT
jgi:signal recognition particle receptor subunit beta